MPTDPSAKPANPAIHGDGRGDRPVQLDALPARVAALEACVIDELVV